MKKKDRTLLAVLFLLSILLIGLISFAKAKYMTTISGQGYEGKITFKASLASDVILQEHEAVPQPDGTYELGDELVTANTYTLLPGVDIPKDPHIVIKGKTPIKAFLFLEIENTLDESVITFQVDSGKWMKTKLTPKNPGATVYLYSTDGKKATVLDQTIDDSYEIPILAPLAAGKPETVRVSQYVQGKVTEATNMLKFHVYLIEQTTAIATPTDAYGGYPPKT